MIRERFSSFFVVVAFLLFSLGFFLANASYFMRYFCVCVLLLCVCVCVCRIGRFGRRTVRHNYHFSRKCLKSTYERAYLNKCVHHTKCTLLLVCRFFFSRSFVLFYFCFFVRSESVSHRNPYSALCALHDAANTHAGTTPRNTKLNVHTRLFCSSYE